MLRDALALAVSLRLLSFSDLCISVVSMTEEEYAIGVDQLVADIDERVSVIDGHIGHVKEMLSSLEVSHHQDKALFYAMNLMLRERKSLVERKERVLLKDAD